MPNRPLSTARRLAIGLVVLLVAGALAAPAVASGATTTDGVRAYRASVAAAGDCVVPDRPGVFTLTLTNTSRTIQLGSANVTLEQHQGWQTGPTGVEVDGTPVAVHGRTIELRDLALAPLEGVAVSFTATPSVGDNAIATIAKQANSFSGPPGNDLRLVGDVPTVVADATCSGLTLRFVVQPGDAAVGQPIPGAPAVAVSDSRGGPVAGVAVTMELGGGTAGGAFATVSTTSAVSAANGIAVFDDLRVDTSGEGYVLEASAVDAETVTSDPFDVDDGVATCTSGEPCEVSLGGVVAAGTALPGTTGRLAVSSYSFGDADCAVPPGVALSRLPEAVRVAGTSLAGKRISFTVDAATRKEVPDNGAASYQVCAEPVGEVGRDTIAFTDRYTGVLVTGAGTTDQPGAGEVRGWLPDCKSGGPNAVAAPCVVSRTGDPSGGVRIDVDFGSRFRMG
jgi:hypothetical protein